MRSQILLIIILIGFSCKAKKQNAVYWYNKGVKKVDRKHYEVAIKFLTKAIQIDQNAPDAYNERGCAKDELGLYSEAIEDYNIAIQLNPNYADAYYNRGNANFDSKKYANAIKDYQKAISLNSADQDYKVQLKQAQDSLR